MGDSVTEQSTLARNNFVGRERELAELVSACETGADSDTHLFLIHGEPGIGKTRLADELASRAKARGVQVLWGRCWEGDGAPAYWPWIQLIRGFLGALDPERRHLTLESEIASDIIQQVAQIVPEMRPAQPRFRPPAAEKLEPDEARFRLFDSVTGFLKIGARSNPMLIVLDDLHDADEASLAMLRFFARELKGTAIVIIATYRDAEVSRSPTLSKLIGEISREARPIPMSGLSETEVKRFVQGGAGRTPDDALVSKLCATTNGNPLFLDGIVRILIAERAIGSAGAQGSPFKIPIGVREAIRGRLGGLSQEANSILAMAAAIGNEFDFDLCRNVADVSADEAHRLLDEASSAGIVTALGQCRYRFSHALIRSALHEELAAEGRVCTHARVANELEKRYRENTEPHAAELAYHFRAANVPEKAIDYSIRAGSEARRVLAYADAMVHLQAALDLMERHGVDVLSRAELLNLLSQVAFEVDRAASLKFAESAIALYDGIGRPDRAAVLHIVLGLIFHYRGEPLFDAALASEHLRLADSAIAKEPATNLLAHLYFAVSCHECHFLNVKETARVSLRSMEISANLGDKRGWAAAASFYAWTLCMSGKLREGFTLFSEAVYASKQASVHAYSAAWGAGMFSGWLGDPRSAREKFELELGRIREEFAPLNHRWLSRLCDEAQFEEGNLRAALEGRGYGDWQIRFWIRGEWEAVAALMEQEADKLHAAGDNIHGALYLSWWAGLANLLFLRDYGRAERLFKYGLDNGERGPVVFLEMRARPWLARVYVAMNRLDDAAEQVARCRQIMADGEDWRGLVGTVARAEASIEAALGNHERASILLESALTIHRRYHTALEESDALTQWGCVLARAGDRERAAEKFDSAIEKYRSCGVGPRLIEWLTDEKTRALEPSPTLIDVGVNGHRLSANSNSTGSFRREGEFWTVTYAGATFRLKDAKGLHYIAYLLAHPGQRFHVYDLIEAVEGCVAGPRRTIHAEAEGLEIVRDIGGAEQSIDARARSEYRIRLRDLHAELEESERMNDLGRSERLRAEIEMVGDELTRSSGLGGRARTASPSAERARGLVGKNLRAVLTKISEEHPALGRYLASSISTGYFCAYQPDPDHAISWQL